NVFILLENQKVESDEDKRLLYVAITRAKQNLTIHLNSNYLSFINTEDLELIENSTVYAQPEELLIQLSFQDVWLGYFSFRQNLISHLKAGDLLNISDS